MNTQTVKTLLLGTLVAGTLDIVFAMAFWAIKAAVAPIRILQSVAAGLLGEASFAGGRAAAALGLALHYLIMFGMVGTYYLLARRLAVMHRRPWTCGVVYGLLLYGVMTYVVVPLSAAGPGPRDPQWIGGSIAMHIVVGLLCALFAVRAIDRTRPAG